MKTSIIIAVGGLLAFCALAAIAVAWTAPAIEATLTAEATNALKQRNLTFAKVVADGRDLVVTGEAPDARLREKAREIVDRTKGRRVVFDEMTVAALQPAALELPPSAVATATRTDGLPPELGDCQDTLTDLLEENQVTFEFGSAELAAESDPLLDRIAETIDQCPDARFEVEGHTDASGSSTVNLRLSERRAQAVLRQLSTRGVPVSDMRAIGYGSSRPIADNTDPEGRALNRRIALRVLRKD